MRRSLAPSVLNAKRSVSFKENSAQKDADNSDDLVPQKKVFKPLLTIRKPLCNANQSSKPDEPDMKVDEPGVEGDPPPSAKESSSGDSVDSKEAAVPDPVAAPLKKKVLCIASQFRNPIKKEDLSKSAASEAAQKGATVGKRYYQVLYCKMSNKKRKSYEDGILAISENNSELMDMEGKTVAKQLGKTAGLKEGETWKVGRQECEIQVEVPQEKFLSGAVFLQNKPSAAPSTSATTSETTSVQQSFKRPSISTASVSSSLQSSTPRTSVPSDTKSCYSNVPVLAPRFDPNAPNALVLNKNHPSTDAKGKPMTDVVVDPILANHMRPHQRDGVQFLYDCLMGVKEFEGSGCILADEMGLGKTLQTIAIMWTLLKQGPYGPPLIRKAIVVTPSSLVENWAREIRKWLGMERLNPLVVHAAGKEVKAQIDEFSASNVKQVLIISYEMYKKHADSINSIKTVGLLVCDEGHRLKNSLGNKTTQALGSIATRKRIILSGTPIQNDLDELYAMISFVNPGVLGPLNAFQRLYGDAIIRGRDPTSTSTEKALGDARSKELSRITGAFILRRTADLLEKYLPPKTELLVFCRLSSLQVELYRHFLRSKAVASIQSGQQAAVLSCITSLKKLCNAPSLVYKQAEDEKEGFAGAMQVFQEGYDPKAYSPNDSGKLAFLERMLADLRAECPNDRIVIVSNYTQTLDVLQSLCDEHKYSSLRLDGSTDSSKRQSLVERFNSPSSGVVVFLLSSKAGGVGLNLIGANRLVLFDCDWNPANDLQAMARVWRDGQKKHVYIYRLFSTGTIEEKIYQRQISKLELGDSVVEDKVAVRHFNPKELKTLFSLRVDTECDTRDLLCKSASSWADQTENWRDSIEDPVLAKTVTTHPAILSWVHCCAPNEELDVIQSSSSSQTDIPITPKEEARKTSTTCMVDGSDEGEEEYDPEEKD